MGIHIESNGSCGVSKIFTNPLYVISPLNPISSEIMTEVVSCEVLIQHFF